MSLDIDNAVHEAFGRLWSRNGAVLLVAMIVVSLLNTVIWQTVQAGFLNDALSGSALMGSEGGGGPFSLGLSGTVAIGLFATSLPFRAAFRVAVVRVFGIKFTDRIPRQVLTTNIVLASIRDLIAVVTVFVIAIAPPVAVVILGVFLDMSLLILAGTLLVFVVSVPALVFLYFVRQEIAIADRGIIGALSGSYGLTDGDRWNTLGLILILGIIRFVLWIPTVIAVLGALMLGFGAGSGIGGLAGGVIGALVGIVFGSAIKLFSIAATTRAYQDIQQKR